MSSPLKAQIHPAAPTEHAEIRRDESPQSGTAHKEAQGRVSLMPSATTMAILTATAVGGASLFAMARKKSMASTAAMRTAGASLRLPSGARTLSHQKHGHDQSSSLVDALRKRLPPTVDPEVVRATLARGNYWIRNSDGPRMLPTVGDRVTKPHSDVILETGSVTSAASAVDYVAAGGLEALTRAERLLVEDPHATVAFVNDGERPIAANSGYQLHRHPTQYFRYPYAQLIHVWLSSNGLWPRRDPRDVAYEPLQMPLKTADDMVAQAKFGGQLLRQQVLGRAVDQGLSDRIETSIARLEALDRKIYAATGKHCMQRKGRFYFSTDPAEMNKKLEEWQELSIPTVPVTSQELCTRTPIDPKARPHGLIMPKDGRLEPDAFDVIKAYLHASYLDRFWEIEGSVHAVRVDPEADRCQVFYDAATAVSAGTTTGSSMKATSLHASRAFLSLGAGNVFADGKLLTQNIPVAGWSANFARVISKDEIAALCGGKSVSDYYAQLCGVADYHNLHITPAGYEEHPDGSVTFYTRVTQGGHFNRWVGSEDDLINLFHKLETLTVDLGDMMSLGSCARQTGVSNSGDLYGYPKAAPIVEVGSGNAGVGVSLSGGRKEMLWAPRK